VRHQWGVFAGQGAKEVSPGRHRGVLSGTWGDVEVAVGYVDG